MASFVPQPELKYQLDLSSYRARSQHHLQTEKLLKELPEAYPMQLRSPLVWEPQDFNVDGNDNEPWVYALNYEQLDEIHHALGHFRSLARPLEYLEPSTFPLPTLGRVLRSLSHDLHYGRGFCVLRCLPVDQYSREDIILIYAGISCYIGSMRGRQDHQYNGSLADVVIAHIKDFGLPNHEVGLASCTTDEIPFHTDVGDIVALLALGVPATGGESLIASSWRVYNELAAVRPDLIQTLADSWNIPRVDASGNSCSQRPLLFHQPSINGDPERVILQFSRRSFTGFRAQRQAPTISEAQAEALDALQFLAEKFHISHNLKKGDVQYINNLSIVHSRKAFKDDKNNQRHLLRLWLRDPEYGWQTPEALLDRWSKTYDMPKEGNQVFPFEPSIRSAAR